MSLFDDVIVNVAAAFDTAGKVAGEVVDRSRARVSSVELKNKISSQFESLGRYVYDSTLSGTTDESVIKGYVNNISELIKEMKTVSDSLSNDFGTMTCPKCSCRNSVDSLFCKKCGASLDFTNSYTVRGSNKAPAENNANQDTAADESASFTEAEGFSESDSVDE